MIRKTTCKQFIDGCGTPDPCPPDQNHHWRLTHVAAATGFRDQDTYRKFPEQPMRALIFYVWESDGEQHKTDRAPPDHDDPEPECEHDFVRVLSSMSESIIRCSRCGIPQ